MKRLKLKKPDWAALRRAFSGLSDAIASDNLLLEDLSLLSEGEIPQDAAALLIYAPQSDLSESERDLILDYLQQGGRLLLVTDYSEEERPNLDAVTAYYGLSSVDGIVLEEDASRHMQGYNYYLQPDEVCVLNWDQMQKIEVTYGGQTHTIEFSGTTTEEVEDSEGETVTQTVNVYRSGEEELSGTEVEALLDAINALSVTARGGSASGEELISFTFYQEVDGYKELTLRLTAQDTASCVADFAGAACQTDRSAVNELVTLAQAVFEN